MPGAIGFRRRARAVALASLCIALCGTPWACQKPAPTLYTNAHDPSATTFTITCPGQAAVTLHPSVAVTLAPCQGTARVTNGPAYVLVVDAPGLGVECDGAGSIGSQPFLLDIATAGDDSGNGVTTLARGPCDAGGFAQASLVAAVYPNLNAYESYMSGQLIFNGQLCSFSETGGLFLDTTDERAPCPVDAGPLDAGPVDGGEPDGGEADAGLDGGHP